MWYRTELMDQILTSEYGQKVIDYVTDIYGESYIGLWLFQIIGLEIGDVREIVDSLCDEMFPDTTDRLITYWEKLYGIIQDESLSLDERRSNLKTKMYSIAPINPAKLETILESLTGCGIEVIEIAGTNQIQVNIDGYVDDLSEVRETIEKLIPAHVIYDIYMAEKMEYETDYYYKIGASVGGQIHATFT